MFSFHPIPVHPYWFLRDKHKVDCESGSKYIGPRCGSGYHLDAACGTALNFTDWLTTDWRQQCVLVYYITLHTANMSFTAAAWRLGGYVSQPRRTLYHIYLRIFLVYQVTTINGIVLRPRKRKPTNQIWINKHYRPCPSHVLKQNYERTALRLTRQRSATSWISFLQSILNKRKLSKRKNYFIIRSRSCHYEKSPEYLLIFKQPLKSLL